MHKGGGVLIHIHRYIQAVDRIGIESWRNQYDWNTTLKEGCLAPEILVIYMDRVD